MKIGTFPEAFHSLKERYRKSFESRIVRIFLWVQLSLILGMICSYLVIWASIRFTVGQIEAHPHQLAKIDWLGNVWWIGFWLFTIGLPVVALILGVFGILPGTRRKDRYDHVA
jgi:ABC-type Fe3+ transport system permease subunit